MMAHVGRAALRVASHSFVAPSWSSCPIGLVTRAAALGTPRNFAMLSAALPQAGSNEDLLVTTTQVQLSEDEAGKILEILIAETDDKTATKLQQSSVENRLCEPGFIEKLVTFRDLHGLTHPQLVRLCNRHSVAMRLGTPEFDDALMALRDDDKHGLTIKQLVKIVNDGVAVRLGTPEFDDALKALRDEYSLDTEQLVKIVSDGVAARLGTPEFDDALKALRDEYSFDTEQLVTIMSDGVAEKLGTPEFDDALKALRDEYGLTMTELVTTMYYHAQNRQKAEAKARKEAEVKAVKVVAAAAKKGAKAEDLKEATLEAMGQA